MRFWTESAELPGSLEAGSDGSEGNLVSTAASSWQLLWLCGCGRYHVVYAELRSRRVSYEDWETRVNNQCFGCSKVGQETCDQFTINCGELRFLMTVLVKLQPSNLRELCFASDMTTGLTLMTWSSQTVEITDVAPTVRHLDVCWSCGWGGILTLALLDH